MNDSGRSNGTDVSAGAAYGTWGSIVGVTLFGLYVAYFFSFDLPNNPDWSRIRLAEELVFEYAADSGKDEASHHSGWQYLPQRFWPVGVAVLILAGAYTSGSLVLRSLRFCEQVAGCEHVLFAGCAGLSMWSLITLAFGLAGFLERNVLLGGLILSIVFEALVCRRSCIARRPTLRGICPSTRIGWSCLIGVLPFVGLMLLGALLPSVDFDVKEYHLQGPKEFFTAGRIGFLPHNVYTSMPFLTEMLSLLSMVLCDDWYFGALAGKAVLAGFAPLTTLAVFALARRWTSADAAWLAVLIHLGTPWTYRISIIAYVEGGLSCFLAAAVVASVRAGETSDTWMARRWMLIAGVMAGSGMACKYPGLISAVVPCACMIAIGLRRNSNAFKDAICGLLLFGVGVAIAVGPWSVKNVCETGNPVYPLAYRIFGGVDWDASLDEKWNAAHSPDNFQLSDLGEKFIDVTSKSDWLSPLLFGLALLTFPLIRRSKRIRLLWLWIGYLFVSWWVLTHRLDRFWIPIIPLVAVLAGAGAVSVSNAWCRRAVFTLIGLLSLFNLGFMSTGLCGYNAYRIDLEYARNARGRASSIIATLNRHLQPGDKVLFVGHADVFDAEFPLAYNTVFDHCLVEQWCRDSERSNQLRDTAEIRREFASRDITHVCVNWRQIVRYRTTYGYTDFVSPELFAKFQERGILILERDLGVIRESDIGTRRERDEFATWGKALRTDDLWTSSQLYRVVQDPDRFR
ncbi:MAG: glycosyltransferase family 39 protein [Planctomycetota bacterium]|nr:glycosyltransferase family 39 protein [Planctomycetota bacterium]